MSSARHIVVAVLWCCFGASACWAQDRVIPAKKGDTSGENLFLILASEKVDSAPKETVNGNDIMIMVPSLLGRHMAGNEYTGRSYLILECRESSVNFYINWQERIGQKGKRRRHLFYDTIYGESHIMLPVLDKQGLLAGYDGQPDKAKALISEMLRALRRRPEPDIAIGVFPEGRDPVVGKWDDAFFSTDEFTNGVSRIAGRCHWDLEKSLMEKHVLVDEVPAGGGED